ncbi:MAG: type II toxin-antitoxin system RelE/ParE family toxin [bacterium]|nr:type II toxin-antitoxin system RelE/ParE family toxin [bacterium]
MNDSIEQKMKVLIFSEVNKFLKSIDIVLREQTLTLIELLAEHGHYLRMPYSRALGKGLFELRIIGKVQVRVFYCFNKGKICLLHSIIKKGQKLSLKDTAHARELKRQVERL